MLQMYIDSKNRTPTDMFDWSENRGPPRWGAPGKAKDEGSCGGYGGRDASDGRLRSSPAKAWVNLVGFTRGGCLLRLGFPPHSNQAKGWRLCRTGPGVSRAFFNRRRSAA